jgi:hypothetical protein
MDKIATIGLVILLIGIIIAGPLLTIWSLNTLFGLGIAYNFYTWLATVILAAAIKTKVEYSR